MSYAVMRWLDMMYEFYISMLVQNLENFEKRQFFKKVTVKAWKSQGKILKKHTSQGNILEIL